MCGQRFIDTGSAFENKVDAPVSKLEITFNNKPVFETDKAERYEVAENWLVWVPKSMKTDDLTVCVGRDFKCSKISGATGFVEVTRRTELSITCNHLKELA